jgi:hypothetical protein
VPAVARTEDLGAAGVRITGVEALASLLRKSIVELKLDATGSTGTGAAAAAGGGDGGAVSSLLELPSGAFRAAAGQVQPAYVPDAVVVSSSSSSRKKPAAAAKLPNWAVSTDRFARGGETLTAVAMSQPSGKPIQVATVRGHLLKGLVAARAPIDLQRLQRECVGAGEVVSRAHWEALDVAAAALTPPLRLVDASEWGVRGDKKFDLVRQPDLLALVDGGALRGVLDKAWIDRSDAERQTYSAWLAAVDWWAALHRVGVPVNLKNNNPRS